MSFRLTTNCFHLSLVRKRGRAKAQTYGCLRRHIVQLTLQFSGSFSIWICNCIIRRVRADITSRKVVLLRTGHKFLYILKLVLHIYDNKFRCEIFNLIHYEVHILCWKSFIRIPSKRSDPRFHFVRKFEWALYCMNIWIYMKILCALSLHSKFSLVSETEIFCSNGRRFCLIITYVIMRKSCLSFPVLSAKTLLHTATTLVNI